MNKPSSFFGCFCSFLNTPGRHLFFTTLFYSLWLVQALALAQNFFSLHHFTGRMIGIATLSGFDVGARVSTFYKCLALLFGAFFAVNLLFYVAFKKKAELLRSVEVRIINYSALAGIFLLFFQLFGQAVSQSLNLLCTVQALMLLALVMRSLFFRQNRLTLYHYSFILVSSFSLYFFVSDVFGIFSSGPAPDFFLNVFFIAGTGLVGVNILLRREADLNQARITGLFYYLLPLALLPLLTVLKDELYLILKARHLHAEVWLIYLLLLCLLSAWVVVRRRNFNRKKNTSQPALLAQAYFPLFIFSLVTYAEYAYYIRFSNEMFELGNKFLPVMEFKLFDVVPTLEKFNSHVLSDYFFSALYTALNGLQGHEMVLYDFLWLPVSYLLYYFLLFYLSRNPFMAFAGVLLFPACKSVLPDQFSVAVLVIFVMHKLISQPLALKNYLLFFLVLGGLIIWRIDLGYAALFVMTILLLYYHFRSSSFRIRPALLVKGLLCVTGATLLLVISFSLYRHINLFKKMPYALNYLSSAQTYGGLILNSSDPQKTLVHYFVFPVLVAIILLGLLLRFQALNHSRGQRLAYLSLLFLCVFYFCNFNRGLVRHGLNEQSDHYTSSFVYIILPGALLVFCQKHTQLFRCIGLFVTSFFLVMNYKIPEPDSKGGFFEDGIETSQRHRSSDLLKVESRVKYDWGYMTNQDSLFIDFIGRHTSPDETFIDFSNNPMLYFYAKKITPSYFYQNPLCSHNDFLQDRFIADLSAYKTPFLVFWGDNGSGMDAVDIVPNTLRHYRMAEYFYKHYAPYIVCGRLCVWKNKHAPDQNPKDTVYRFVNDSVLTGQAVNTELRFKPGKLYLVKCMLSKTSGLKLTTVFPALTPEQKVEFVSDTVAYCLLQTPQDHCTLTLQPDSAAVYAAQVIECDYRPDVFAERQLLYHFSQLAFIWANYDEKLPGEPLLFRADKHIQLKKNEIHALKIPEQLDKSSGNTLVITCRNTSPSPQQLQLSFGNNREHHKATIDFHVNASGKYERYAIRISSIYKWYELVNELRLSASCNELTVSEIRITKGL